MATFTWTVTRMDVMASVEGKTDMVVTVAWSCDGFEVVDGVTYQGTVSEETPIPYVPADPWVDYPDLTETDALMWCWEHGVDKAAIEAQVQGVIDATPKPPVAAKPLPW